MKDACEICHGEKGGVPGNENVLEIGGKRTVVCDYCSVPFFNEKGSLRNPDGSRSFFDDVDE